MSKFKIALVLGGGGARGLAHLGALKVLQRANIPIDLIVGTSSGAVVGAMYAHDQDIAQIEKKLRLAFDTLVNKEFNLEFIESLDRLNKPGFVNQITSLARKLLLNNLVSHRLFLVSTDKVQRLLNILLPDTLIEKTKIPFAAISVDIVRGKKVVIIEGPIRQGCQASMAIPGIVPPVQKDKQLLVDGGAVCSVPVEEARRLGADFVIAVEVEPRLRRMSKISSGLQMIDRARHLTQLHFSRHLLETADIIVSPRVKNYHWANFRKVDLFIKMGEIAAEEKIYEIKKKIQRKKWKHFWRNLIV
ncbi:MAG: patatin-like phospholipase family protein [Elusimicrobiota bacterium]